MCAVQHFFVCAKFPTVAKSLNDLRQVQKVFIDFFQNLPRKKVGEKGVVPLIYTMCSYTWKQLQLNHQGCSQNLGCLVTSSHLSRDFHSQNSPIYITASNVAIIFDNSPHTCNLIFLNNSYFWLVNRNNLVVHFYISKRIYMYSFNFFV